jgi:hypothetical protein
MADEDQTSACVIAVHLSVADWRALRPLLERQALEAPGDGTPQRLLDRLEVAERQIRDFGLLVNTIVLRSPPESAPSAEA